MRSSTICEIDIGTQKGFRYWTEGGRIVFTPANSARPKGTDLATGDLIFLYDFDNIPHLTHRDENIKMTEDSVIETYMWHGRTPEVKHGIVAGDLAFNHHFRLGDWQDTDCISLGRRNPNALHAFERAVQSTVTNISIAGTPRPGFFDPTYQADQTSYVGKPIEDAFRQLVGVVVLTEGSRDPIPSETRKALDRIRALSDNWDGDGASRIGERTVAKAERLFREAFLAAPEKLKPPSVAPAFGGMIVAEWSGPRGRELILDIPAGDEAPGFLLVERTPGGEEIETDEELVPPWSMRDLIARLMGD
jgi:hypothetical protein